jgi:hypothetical protein
MPARLPSGTCTVARMYGSTCAFVRTHIVSTLYLRAGDARMTLMRRRIRMRGSICTSASRCISWSARARAHLRAHLYSRIHAYTHTRIHAYTHTRIHAYTHTHIHAYTHTRIRTYTHTRIRTYTHPCIYAYTLRVRQRASAGMQAHTLAHTQARRRTLPRI